MNQQAIDKLAAFCRLADKGYRRDPDGYWVLDRLGLDRFAWRPDESDDDCRVVLERFWDAGSIDQRIAFVRELFNDKLLEGGESFAKRFILASPREKCEAVLRVLEGPR